LSSPLISTASSAAEGVGNRCSSRACGSGFGEKSRLRTYPKKSMWPWIRSNACGARSGATPGLSYAYGMTILRTLLSSTTPERRPALKTAKSPTPPRSFDAWTRSSSARKKSLSSPSPTVKPRCWILSTIWPGIALKNSGTGQGRSSSSSESPGSLTSRSSDWTKS